MLTYHVFLSAARPMLTTDLPPNVYPRKIPPISAPLIVGRQDAVLVDPLLTIDDARLLGDWIAATGKNLTTICATHGHGDHFFGAGIIRDRFPNARFVAMPPVIKRMQQQIEPDVFASFWTSRFPGQIPERPMIAAPLDGDVIDLEGHDLFVVPLGHTDTVDSTCLHVPSISLVVAGDAAYNDVHLYPAKSSAESRREWIAALDTIESLRPHAVVAGHKKPEKDDSPRIIEETRQYIRDFDRVAKTSTTARALRQDAGALSGSGQSGLALGIGPRRQRGGVSHQSDDPHIDNSVKQRFGDDP